MENNPIIEKFNPREIHHNFLDLLETADNIDNFAQSCYQLLSKWMRLHGFIIGIFQENNETIEIVYQNINQTKTPEYLSIIDDLITSNNGILDDNFNPYVAQNFNKYSNVNQNLQENNLNYLYLLPLHFKGKYLGNLLIDIDIFFIPEDDMKKVLIILGKYLAIYLYQKQLEFQENELKKKQEILNQNKINQSQYLSHMNHELRTPISAVIGFSKMLQQRLYGELNPKQAQYIDAIYQSGKYLLDLISDLLDLSKIEAKKENLYIEKVFVKELCESAIALIKTKAEERKLDLICSIEPNIKYCYIDERRIKQVLVNLLSNAVKFTEKGSITLEVKQDKSNLFFRVIDTGIGIKKESQTKLFQPFSQLNTHLHKQCKGTGLGLVISRELARLHGGDITLISEENQGSCFTLNIPKLP
ncbi:sensor histidine kinase [Geminocystis herdmanii]|uniref:sensor histidine kinase n=1 Tax=Geminocystis herdmanii TaxID=669359 RepID=UPI000347266E|nr:HAMP domain-containing sensor histidine kinase [Geminocystis herdmanii]